MNMTTEMVQRMINEPLALEQTMTMTMGGEAEELQSAVYLEADGDNLITYTQMEGEWYKTTQSGFEALKAYDSTGAMALYMEAVEKFKKVGTEEVAGVKANNDNFKAQGAERNSYGRKSKGDCNTYNCRNMWH